MNEGFTADKKVHFSYPNSLATEELRRDHLYGHTLASWQHTLASRAHVTYITSLPSSLWVLPPTPSFKNSFNLSNRSHIFFLTSQNYAANDVEKDFTGLVKLLQTPGIPKHQPLLKAWYDCVQHCAPYHPWTDQAPLTLECAIASNVGRIAVSSLTLAMV